jgi:hypothetical protein
VVEEYTIFATEVNHANTLTRRREAYHDLALEERAEAGSAEGGTPSIHDLEEGIRLDRRPPRDAEDRALFVDRVLPGSLSEEQYASGDYLSVRSWARTSYNVTIEEFPDAVELVCEAEGLLKRLRFFADGALTVIFNWDGSAGNQGDCFATELSLFAPLEWRADPAADIWTFAIETVAKSERGLDRTRQGESVTLRWPVRLGAATIEIQAPAATRLTPAEAGQSQRLS